MEWKNNIYILILNVSLLCSCTPDVGVTGVTNTAQGNEALIAELKSLHFDKYLESTDGAYEVTHETGWDIYHYNQQEYPCILGDEYFLMARSGEEADKTVLWLAGGGTCWPGHDECTKEPTFYPSDGISGLASTSKDNPVSKWNFIYVPYCDGSMHMGDSAADYDGDGVVDHYHMGLKMTSAAVRLMADLFPDTQKILIGGCSAGGGGTIGATPVVRLQFPRADLYVLNVSGSTLVNREMRANAQIAKDTWKVAQFIPQDCPKCQDQLIYTYAWLLERDQDLKVGMFSSYQDEMVSNGWDMQPQEFQGLLTNTTDSIHGQFPEEFKRYFIKGDTHCLIDYSYRANGFSFWDWVGYMVSDDPGWVEALE